MSKKIRIVCANCQKETEVHTEYGTMSEIKKWVNEHKTRIGRTYCSIEFVSLDFNSLQQGGKGTEDE